MQVDQKEGFSIDLENRISPKRSTDFEGLRKELLKSHNESYGWTPDYFISEECLKFNSTPTEFCDKLEGYFKPDANSTPATWKVWPLIDKWLQQERREIEIRLNPTAKPESQQPVSTDFNLTGQSELDSSNNDLTTQSGKPLNATQKVLLIRLLQAHNIFPTTTYPTGTKELTLINKATGLKIENQLKGTKGTVGKADEIMENSKEGTKSKLTLSQLPSKINDLERAREVVELAGWVEVLTDVNLRISKLTALRQS